MIGTVLSHYRIVEKIGEGGMGEVYRADDLRLPRSVAVKILPEKALASPERRERFVREARAASSLNHPGIVHIYDIDESEGRLFIAMEYVAGRTVSELLEERSMDLHEILKIGVEAGEALAAAHAHGIVHRDVKPSNIMLAEEGFVKILDFGLAKLLRDGEHDVPPDDASTRAPNLTRHGQLIGTVLYMSPELALGETVDHRSDVFSFGAVLYEMASRRLPFTGPSEVAILDKILHAPPDDLSGLAPDLPDSFLTIVAKAMEKRPEDRYQSVDDLVVDLRRVQREIETLPGKISAGARPARAVRWGLLWAALAVTIAVGAATLMDRAGGRPGPAGRPTRSVAVFPFKNADGDPNGRYFSEGITEGIILDLSRIAGLRILAPPGGALSSEEDSLEAGRRLDADLMLEGTVRREGGRIRVFCSLLHVSDGQVLWTERIDRPFGGVFELQDEVSRRIAQALEIRLTRDEHAQIARIPTRNLLAYDLYLQGRELVKRRTEPALKRAVALFERALEQDPEFALAWAGLANAYSVATVYGWDLGEGAREKAMEASERAIELDRTLAEAHITRGVAAAVDGDLAGGISRALHAVSLAPDSPFARHWLSVLYKIEGRYEEAEKEGRLALELDPELGVAHLNLAHIAILSGHPEAAEERMRAVTNARPELLLARVLLAWAQIRQGETRQALETLAAAGVIAPEDPLVAGMRGLALAVAGEEEGARAEASRAVQLSAEAPSALADYAVAGIYALTGSPGEAFSYLRRALEAGTRDLWFVVPGDYVREDPHLASLRTDPRFEELVQGLRGSP